MITRSNLAEQLREYHIRSKHDWATVSLFSSASSSTSSPSYSSSSSSSSSFSRVDVILVIWELLMFAFLVFSGVSLYFRYTRVAFGLICVTMLILVCMKITKQVRKNRKSKRRMLLPLSM